jgi:hypothetical protein
MGQVSRILFKITLAIAALALLLVAGLILAVNVSPRAIVQVVLRGEA